MRGSLLSLLLICSCNVIAVEQVQVLGLFTGKAILTIDGQRYTLQIGEVSPEGVVLIAADSDKAVLEIDGKRRELELGSQISSYYPEPKKRVAYLYQDSGGMYRGSGTINGQTISFLVDTGATAIAMNSAQAKQLDIDYLHKGIPGVAETASERVRIYVVKLDKVSVGAITVYGVDAMVIEGEQPSEVLLGQSFLNQLHMKREGSLLRLEQGH